MCVQTIIEEVAQIPWEIVPKDEDLRESPPEDIQAEIDEATYLLNNPNDNKGETINTLFRAAIRDSLEIDALAIVKGFSLNSYVQHPAGGFELKPRGQRQLTELFARDGGSFLKETDVNGIEYRYWQYSYLHPAVAPIEFDVNEIVYGMRYPRSYSVYGWGEIQSMETVLNSLINSAFTNATMFQEYSVPSGVISFTGSEEDETRLREYFRTEIKGRFHKVAVLNKEAKFTPLTYTNRDLEFIQGQQWFSKIVWAIYKLTPSELGFTDDIRATGKAMSAQGLVQKRKAVLPVLRLMEQWMTNQIINEISDRIVFAFKYVDKEQEMAEDQADLQKITQGALLLNEYRAKKDMGAPVWYGNQPLAITLEQMKAQAPKLFAPSSPRQVGSSSAAGEGPPTPKIPLSAEGQAIIQSFKAWGGVPNEGYDFAAGSLGGNDKYAAPVLTYDNRTGQVKVLPQATMTMPGRRYINRDGQIFTVPIKKPLPVKPSNPQRTGKSMKSGLADRSEAVVKQYAKPTRAPYIGPYEADRKPAPKMPTMVGGNQHEVFRNDDLLPGEDPEEARRARDAVGPKAPGARARANLATNHDYPMGALGYRPDEPPAKGDVGQEQTPEQIVQGRQSREYVRPSKPFGPMEHTQPHRTGPKETYRGGPGNIPPRRQGGRIRKIGHPSLEAGPESTGEVWRETPEGKKKVDLFRGGAGIHKWERDETNVPIAMAGEEPGETHVDPHLIRKPYPGRHRKVTGGGGYDVESRIVPTRAGTPKIIDGSKPYADLDRKFVRMKLSKADLNVDNVWKTHDLSEAQMNAYFDAFDKERKKHPDFSREQIWQSVKGHMKAFPRGTQPDNAPVAPLAQPRENRDPVGGAGTSQAPRLKPTPTIRRGPKYPRDVPPVQPDTVQEETGGAGAMRSTAPSGVKSKYWITLHDGRHINIGDNIEGAHAKLTGSGYKYSGVTHSGERGVTHQFDHAKSGHTIWIAERGDGKIHGTASNKNIAGKFVLQDSRGAPPPTGPGGDTNTGALGPDHRETLGYVERDLSKIHDGVKRSAWAQKNQPRLPLPKQIRKQVNAYTAKEEWKGGRLETHLARAPKKREIQEAAKKAIGPKHGHPEVFQGSVQAERGLARKLTGILKAYRERKLSKNAAMRQGLAAIDKNLATVRAIARSHTARMVGKDIATLAPAVERRLNIMRKTHVEDFEEILRDAKP